MKAAMTCAFAAFAGLCATADVATVEGFTGADHTETLQGSVYSFSDTAGGTLTLSHGGAVDILVVGGGGGGGYDVAGGGGAGGFVYEEDVELPAGTYAIAVGAGGAWATGNSMTGESGGDSSISALSPFAGIVAFGGGGGGSWWGARDGGSGGSGGGASGGGVGGASGGAGVSGQGNSGGNSANERWLGGGGGAGAAGEDGAGSGLYAGAGGDGLACSITGEEIWYAGGGGAGAVFNLEGYPGYGGAGGRGGGGYGGGTDPDDSSSMRNAANGVDGLGGGGGGGYSTGSAGVRGGRGGSGVVIVRIRKDSDDPSPIVSSARIVSASYTTASISYNLVSLGYGAAECDIVARYGYSAGSLEFSAVLESGVDSTGFRSAVLSHLSPGTNYCVRIYARNDLLAESAASDVLSFSTPVGNEGIYDTTVHAEVSGVSGATAARDGSATVYSFSDTTAAGSITVDKAGTVDILVVGGGGGGGFDVAGGGGAGGFVYLESHVLAAGTYPVSVGAGGSGSTNAAYPGETGGDTVFGDDLVVAYGGGGGGSWNGHTAGAGGGSGGGASGNNGYWISDTGGAGVDGQGNKGGDSVNTSWLGGGGGAGSAGADGAGIGLYAGAGGDGLACSITGEEIWYAGGGGAGAVHGLSGYPCYGGAGGRGGGGYGGGTDPDNASAMRNPANGADGLGGGGGGGYSTGAAGVQGANGGSGVVILRVTDNIDGDMPVGPDSEGGRVLAFTPGTFAGGCVRGTVSIASGLSGATLYFCQAADYSGEDTVWTESAIGSAVGAGELSRQIAQNVANGNYIVRIKATLGDYDYWSEPFSIAEMRGYGNAGLVICIH